MISETFLHQVAKADAELFHSNMLAFLWKKYYALANVKLTNNFLDESDVVTSEGLTREKLHIDILFRANGKVVAIENKLKSRHTKKQLDRYSETLRAKYPKDQIRLIGLTPTHLDATNTAERLCHGDERFSFISYEDHVIPFLTEALTQANEGTDQSAAFYLRDYLAIVSHLVEKCKKFEGYSANFGTTLRDINVDDELKELRLVPLMQQQVFERIHTELQATLKEADQDDCFDLGEVGIASKSIQGQITLALKDRIDFKIGEKAFAMGLGLQLEGTKLRRSIVFEKEDGSEISVHEKKSIHNIASSWQLRHRFFCRDGDLLAEVVRPVHFPESADLYPLLAFKNSRSVFYVYRDLKGDKITKLNLREVAELLAKELVMLSTLDSDYRKQHP